MFSVQASRWDTGKRCMDGWTGICVGWSVLIVLRWALCVSDLCIAKVGCLSIVMLCCGMDGFRKVVLLFVARMLRLV